MVRRPGAPDLPGPQRFSRNAQVAERLIKKSAARALQARAANKSMNRLLLGAVVLMLVTAGTVAIW